MSLSSLTGTQLSCPLGGSIRLTEKGLQMPLEAAHGYAVFSRGGGGVALEVRSAYVGIVA